MSRRFPLYLPALFGVLAVLALGVATIISANPSSAAPTGAATLQIDTSRPTDGTEPLPPGASIQTVLPNLTGGPVKMAFDPSGRLFYNEKNTGNVRMYANGALQAAPVFHVAAQSDGERGLLGIAIDPNFSTNHYIYIYWSCGVAGGCPNPFLQKITRFVENNGAGSGGIDIWTATDDAAEC